MHRSRAPVVVGLLIIGVASLSLAASPEKGWTTFRGPDRTAVSEERGLLQEWPEGGPRLVWETVGAGKGYSSLAISGGRIYSLGDAPSIADDEDEYLTCFDQQTGEPVWKTKVGPAWAQGQPNWQSARSTPTVDGEQVYVLTPHGDLVCYQTSDGQELWRKNVKRDFEGRKGDNWGYSESVLIDGDRLICTPGGDKATMVALDKNSGELVWKAVREGDRGAGHASIVISQIGPLRVYVQTTASGALGVRASDGHVLWSYPIGRTTAVIPTPIVRDDLVFFSAGYKRGGALLRQVPGPEGEVTVDEVYPLEIALANKHGGVVLVGDYLYGDSDDKGIPWCAELMTGEVQWKERGSGRGSASFAAADGRLYIHFADGTMVLAKADPKEYVEVGKFKVPGSGDRPSWSHPVVLGGKLYVREQDRIFCYDVEAK
jgi:outer membrane protein assembly factor BamB